MTFIDIKLELPDKLATQAEAAGLLSPRELERILRAEIKRVAARQLASGACRALDAGSKPMSMQALQREIIAVRAEQRAARN
jgi:hypothetical protein